MGRLILYYADCEHDCATGGGPGWLVGRNVHDSGIDEAAGDHLWAGLVLRAAETAKNTAFGCWLLAGPL